MIKIIKSLIIGIVLGYVFVMSSWAISTSFFKVQLSESTSNVSGPGVNYWILVIVVIAITLFVWLVDLLFDKFVSKK